VPDRACPHSSRHSSQVGRSKLRVFLVLLLLFCVSGIGLALWLRSSLNDPVEHESADRVFIVETGSSTQAIVERLHEVGIVRYPRALNIYLRLTGRGARLKAGDYKFPSPISALQAIEKIQRGEVSIETVTVPEGLNRFEIADRLAIKTGKASVDEFHRLIYDVTPIAKLSPEARNLEGYLFPDTYSYSSRTTPEELIRSMVERFQEVFTPEWKARASRLGMTVHQAVTLASIIEKEARVMDERPIISSVFQNRLRIGMPLASDPTFIYAAVLAHDYDGNPNQPRHRRRESPYNTYLRSGLPPGPIASPGRASMEAALYPADTDYLYFVVNGNGGRHKFSRTASEHEAAVEAYHRQQREQRQQPDSNGR
jgi:peptidoglycan lytic transglycosylase G